MPRFAAHRLLLAVAVGGVVAWPSTGFARDHRGPFIPTAEPIEAPVGFVEFCVRDATFCGNPSDAVPADVVRQSVDTAPTGAIKPSAAAAAGPGDISAIPTDPAQPRNFAQTEGLSFMIPAPVPGWQTANAAAQAWRYRLPASFGPSSRAPSCAPAHDMALRDLAVAGDRPCFAAQCGSQTPTSAYLIATDQPSPLEPIDQSISRPIQRSSVAFEPVATATVPQVGDGPLQPPVAPADIMRVLKRVNSMVNRRVRQMTDAQNFHEAEWWQRSGIGPSARGDCEDIAIEKRYQLIAAGVPKSSMAFAVVYTRSVGLHTVLIVHTAEGDWVLDSLSGYVRNWSRAAYSWISVQSMQNPLIWYHVAPDPAGVATAAPPVEQHAEGVAA